MSPKEIMTKSGDIGSGKGQAKGYEEFKPKILPFPKPKDNGDKPKPPAGGAALPIPKAAMKHEGFKSFSEWLETRIEEK